MNKGEKLQPVHPGEVLLEEFLKPMNLSQNVFVKRKQGQLIIEKRASLVLDPAL